MGRKNYWKGTSDTRRNDNVFSFGKSYKTSIYKGGKKWSGCGSSPAKSQSAASNKYHGGNKKGGCFITSACVEARGLPDNCSELVTLREFRDNYLANIEDGPQMIRSYYGSAPRVVAAIDSSLDSREVYAELYESLVQRCVGQIRQGDNEGALATYKGVFERLSERYL